MKSSALLLGIFVARAFAQSDPPAPSPFEPHDFPAISLGEPVEDSTSFARDGFAVAYCVLQGEKTACVLGAKVIGSFTFANPPLFGAKGNTPAWRVGDRVSEKAERWRMYIGEKVAWESEFIGDPAWQGDGETLAYWIGPGTTLDGVGIYKFEKCSVVFRGRAGPEFRCDIGTEPPVVSPDGRHVAYDVNAAGKGFIVVDGKKLTDHQIVDGPAFSGDSKDVAYAFGEARGAAVKWTILAGLKKLGAEFDQAASPVYAPSGRSIAFKASKRGRYFIVVDQKVLGDGHDATGVPVFSPDGKRVAYAANTGGKSEPMGPSNPVTRFGEFTVTGGKWSVVVDSRRGEGFDRIDSIAFSPDGKRLAYRAKSGRQWFMVVDESKHGPYDDVGEPVWSPDSKRVAHGTREARALRWVIH